MLSPTEENLPINPSWGQLPKVVLQKSYNFFLLRIASCVRVKAEAIHNRKREIKHMESVNIRINLIFNQRSQGLS